MKKKKKRMLSIAGMCCCGFLAAATAISGSSAYQTDHDEVVNIIRTGNNTIIPDEDFPTPTPVPSSGSVVKKVRAKNTGDVPCYVRAYITCSISIHAPARGATKMRCPLLFNVVGKTLR